MRRLARYDNFLCGPGGGLMIEIQCTSCHTRYRIDERVLPDDTPTFKCSRCGQQKLALPLPKAIGKPIHLTRNLPRRFVPRVRARARPQRRSNASTRCARQLHPHRSSLRRPITITTRSNLNP